MCPVSPSINVTNDTPGPGVHRREDGEGGEQDRDYDDAHSATDVEDDFQQDADMEVDMARVPDAESDDGEPLTCMQCDDNAMPIAVGPCCNYRIPNSLTSPIKPLAKDVDAHNCTHLPYRNWCKPCVEAKLKEAAHYRTEKDEEDKSGLPIVSMDYAALNEEYDAEGNRITGESDEKDEKRIKMIIGKDEVTSNVFAHFVLCKGVHDEWVNRKIVRDLEEIGRAHTILKTDGEPALVALQNRLQTLRAGRTVPRNPPAYNPQSNGACEKAVQDVTAQLRVIKLGLEARLDTKIDDWLPIVQWMLEHATFLLNKFNVGEDGMTPHERTIGRKWRRPVVEFGEVVLAKMALRKLQKGKKKKQKRKLALRCVEGIWVGQVARTGENIVIKESGDAVRCRTIRRVPIEHRWKAERVLLVRATPRLPAPSSKNPEVMESRLVDDEARESPAPREDRPSQELADEPREAQCRDNDIREFRITDRLLEKYGYSENCPGCEHKILQMPGHRLHTAPCRERLRNCMEHDEHDKKAIDGARERIAGSKKQRANEADGMDVTNAAEVAQPSPETPRFGMENEPNDVKTDGDANPKQSNDEDIGNGIPELGDSDSNVDMSEDENAKDDPLAEHKRRFDEEEDDEDDEPSSPRKKQKLVSLNPGMRWRASQTGRPADVRCGECGENGAKILKMGCTIFLKILYALILAKMVEQMSCFLKIGCWQLQLEGPWPMSMTTRITPSSTRLASTS